MQLWPLGPRRPADLICEKYTLGYVQVLQPTNRIPQESERKRAALGVESCPEQDPGQRPLFARGSGYFNQRQYHASPNHMHARPFLAIRLSVVSAMPNSITLFKFVPLAYWLKRSRYTPLRKHQKSPGDRTNLPNET